MPEHYPKSRILRETLVPADMIRRLDWSFSMLEAQLEPVGTPPDLEDVDDISLLDGTRKPVEAGQQTFYIDRTSVAPPNGSTVLATKSGEGRWLLLPSAGGALPASVQRFWVGKHGIDTNTGLSYDQAFLTFGAAVAAATALTPTVNNQFVITCMDAGIYAEAITLVPWVNLFAPGIILQGQLTVADDTFSTLGRIEVSSGYGVLKPAGQTGTSRVEAQTLVATGTASGAANLATGGVAIFEIRSLFVQNGNGIGDTTSNNGHTHVMIEDVYLTGPAAGIVRAGAGTTVGYVAHILETGAGIGAGAAIIATGGEVSLKAITISANTSYNVGAAATVRLDCNQIAGTPSITGLAYVNTAGYLTAIPANWAGTAPTDLNTAMDRMASAVVGLLGFPIP